MESACHWASKARKPSKVSWRKVLKMAQGLEKVSPANGSNPRTSLTTTESEELGQQPHGEQDPSGEAKNQTSSHRCWVKPEKTWARAAGNERSITCKHEALSCVICHGYHNNPSRLPLSYRRCHSGSGGLALCPTSHCSWETMSGLGTRPACSKSMTNPALWQCLLLDA